MQTFTTEDWASSKKYLTTFTSEDSDIYILYNFLYINKAKLLDIFAVESFAASIFPKSTIKAVSNYMSTLLGHIENWMVIEQLEKVPYSKELFLIKALNEKGLYNLADRQYFNTLKDMEEEHPLNPGMLLHKHLLLHAMYYSNNPFKSEYKGNVMEDLTITFFDFCKIHLQLFKVEMQSWSRIKKQNFEAPIDMLSNMIDYMNSTLDVQNLIELEILVKDFDVESFINLKSQLLSKDFKNAGQLHSLMTYYLISIAAKLWRTGQLKDLGIIKELYDYGFSSKILTSHGKISNISFLNTVTQVSSFYSFEETNEFIDKWINLVHKNEREAAKALAKALNCFHHEQYDGILKYLFKFKFKNIENKVQSSSLQLIAAFIERRDLPDAFQTALHNFKFLLLRSKPKISELMYQSYKNFIDFLKHMEGDKIESIAFGEYKSLSYRSWCMKMAELELTKKM